MKVFLDLTLCINVLEMAIEFSEFMHNILDPMCLGLNFFSAILQNAFRYFTLAQEKDPPFNQILTLSWSKLLVCNLCQKFTKTPFHYFTLTQDFLPPQFWQDCVSSKTNVDLVF